MSHPVALAIAAHPDDIEFTMSGTLLLLKEAGYETHYLNVASGSCGSARMGAARTRRVRAAEARESARILGAQFHPSLADDLEIFYEESLLRRLAAVVREVKPTVVLTHPLADYMEDHMNTARLAITAVFARGMPNFRTRPVRPVYRSDVVLYHAMPHGLRDGMGRLAVAEAFVDVASVQAKRAEALAAHRSQQEWLDSTQGMSSFLAELEAAARAVGRMSRRFRLAEGWCRHNSLGLGEAGVDPLRMSLGKSYCLNKAYSRWLGFAGK